MPVEIRELHIRVTVNQEAGKQAPAQQAAPAEGGHAGNDDVVAQCVEQVLDILQSKKER